MKLPMATYPKQPVKPFVQIYCYGVASLLIIMATAQLMTFEKFVPIMQNYQLFNDVILGKVLAGLIVIGEVIALPFVLRMKISPLMRITCMALLIITGLLWLALGVWAVTTNPPLIGTGIFGSLVKGTGEGLVLVFGITLSAVSVLTVALLRHDISIYLKR